MKTTIPLRSFQSIREELLALWQFYNVFSQYLNFDDIKQNRILFQERQRILVLYNVLHKHLTKEWCENESDRQDQKLKEINGKTDEKSLYEHRKYWGRQWALYWVMNINWNIRPIEGY